MNKTYFFLIVLSYGCATFIKENSPTLTPPEVPHFLKKYNSACISVKYSDERLNQLYQVPALVQQSIIETIKKTGSFEKIYVLDSNNNLKCDIRFKYTIPFDYEFYSRGRYLWWLISGLSLAIIPYRAERERDINLEAIDTNTKIVKTYHYAEKYIYWQSIIFFPSIFFPQFYSDRFTVLRKLTTISVINALKDFEK